MDKMNLIIAAISFSIGVISFLSLNSPRTPIGKKIYKYLIFDDSKITVFFKYYRIFILKFTFGLLLLSIYLLFSYADFYSTQANTFSIVYFTAVYTVIAYFISLFVMRNVKMLDNVIKRLSYLLGYILIIMAYFYIAYSLSFNNYFRIEYMHVRSNMPIDELMELDSSKTIDGYMKNYQNYIISSSYINRIVSYYYRTNILPKLSSETSLRNTTEQRKLEIAFVKHVEHAFDKKFQSQIFARINEGINSSITGKNLFPLKLEPRFLTSEIIFKHSYLFSRVAVVTKLLIVELYTQFKDERIRYFGVFLILQMLLFSYFLASAIKSYNKKYDETFSHEHFNFLAILAFMSIIIGIYSLVI